MTSMICSSWCSALTILIMSKTSMFRSWWALLIRELDCKFSPANLAWFRLDLRACNDLGRSQLSSSNCCPGGTCHNSCLMHSLSRFPSTNTLISARFALSILVSCSKVVIPDHGSAQNPICNSIAIARTSMWENTRDDGEEEEEEEEWLGFSCR